MKLRNWLRHKLGWNQGEIMSWLSPEARVFIGFMCYECGTIHGVKDITNMVDKATASRT